MYQIKQNLGACVEKIMSNTAEYYIQNNIAYFKKAYPEYIHLSKKSKSQINFLNSSEFNKNSHLMQIGSKGDLDFYGVYKGKYFSIELKETKKEIFNLSLLKNHQLEQLSKIYLCGGKALLLIHFFLSNSKYILLSYSELLKLLELKKKKRFSITDFKRVKSYELEIIFPSIFNLIEKLDQIIIDS